MDNTNIIWPFLVIVTINCLNLASSQISDIHGSDLPTYKQFNDELHHLQQKILDKYPKYWVKVVNETEDVLITFPPPKGSNISSHPSYENMYTMLTNVHIRILVERIVSMNVEEQSLTLVVNEIFTWDDLSLHDSVIDQYPYFQMDVSVDRIWIPNIYATKVFGAVVLQQPTHVQVTSGSSNPDFDCHMIRKIMYTIPCSVDVRNFPFDIHNCSLVLTQPPSWNYRMQLIPLLDEEVQQYDIMDIYSNDYSILEWQFTNWSNTVMTAKFAYNPSLNQSYMLDEFKFTLVLKRQAMFYFVVLLVPCFLLNSLTLVIFTLPLKDQERENFAVSLILSYVVLILLVVQSSPPSGKTVPLLGLYTIICTAIVLLAFIMSLVLIEIHEHYRAKERDIPSFCLKMIDNKLCKTLFTNKETYACLYKQYREEEVRPDATDTIDEGISAKQGTNNFLVKFVSVPAKQLGDVPVGVQWKIFCKFVNFICFLITLLTHVVTASVLFYLS